MSARSLRLNIAAIALVFGIAGCQGKPSEPREDAVKALTQAGYAPAPIILSVVQDNPATFTVTGQALPDGRVRFLYGQQRAIGVTADSKGRFTAELPAAVQGNIYDLSMEDAGRLMHAEGRLFVPPGQPAKAVLMRPGAPSLPIAEQGLGLAVIDYDAAGAFSVTGRSGPKAQLNIILGGEVRAQPTADETGQFMAVTQIPSPGDGPQTITVLVEAGATTWRRQVTVTRPMPDGDHVTLMPEGWRVDWTLPGGGTQTTLVF